MSSSPLLVRPRAAHGDVHAITPRTAGWRYVGFALHRLDAGESVAGVTGVTGGREALLVVVEGHACISVGDEDFGECGTRASVFEQIPPDAVYAPGDSTWGLRASRDGCTVAVCTAPYDGGHAASKLAPAVPVTRGTGTNERTIHPIAMEESDVADRLLVTEVYTPAGHWSSYPPHRHDEDDFPRMTLLEETYWHRLDPPTGFGIQRVFTEDGTLDETLAVGDGDVVLVPRGHHPCAAPHGIRMYYLNVMAGPRRAWRFAVHPDWATGRAE